MKNNGNALMYTLLFVSTVLFSQSQPVPCGAITERVAIPRDYQINTKLPPDPCDALSSYGTEKVLTVTNKPEYVEIQKRIRVVVETLIDPDNCTSTAHELSRDTVEIARQLVYEASTTPTGGYWTVRMELVVEAPESRPEGFYATKLPEGAMSQQYKDGSSIELKEYWVVHTKQCSTKQQAITFCKEIKKIHPEFCRAYPYFLPKRCEIQYKYIAIKKF